MENEFRRAEEQYYRLRGRYSIGRINEDEFDAALRNLVVRDEQGRDWMLGANSGLWYYYDGTDWIQADPTEGVPPIKDVSPLASSGRSLPLGLIGLIAITLVGLGIVLVLALNSPDLVVSNVSLPTATRIVPPTFNVGAPLPTSTLVASLPFSAATPTPPPIVSEVTPVPVTLTPTLGFYVEPTESSTPVLIPTVTPLAPRTGAPSDTTAGSENISFDQNTDADGAQSFDNLPPGIYVLGLQVLPVPARRHEPVTYNVTFLNTSGAPRSFDWRIVVLNQDKRGRNKDWGQSDVQGITIPPGTHTYSISYTTVTNPGGCITLQAVPGWRREDSARMFFVSPNGNPLIVNFQVC
ncbi:MAG TPA: hypothetical protein VFD70_07570 [Anaerolineae bacterium]|nr:hypothetical protein [Anaerolineae bacterium]